MESYSKNFKKETTEEEKEKEKKWGRKGKEEDNDGEQIELCTNMGDFSRGSSLSLPDSGMVPVTPAASACCSCAGLQIAKRLLKSVFFF